MKLEMFTRIAVLMGIGLAGAVLAGSRTTKSAFEPAFNPSNGHYYLRVDSQGIDWFDANATAQTMSYLGMQGHLVTITDQEEQDFVASNLVALDPPLDGHWIGAYQDTSAPDYVEPGGGWRWITGEPWSYTCWGSGEPNDVGGDEHWALVRQPLDSTWNDLYHAGLNEGNMGNGFIVEFDHSCHPITWTGVLPPVNADGSSVFKFGRSVPVKFALTGECSADTGLLARLLVASVTGGTVGSEFAAVSTSSANSGNLFRFSDGHYIYNLNTQVLSPGQWRLRIDLGDGVARTVLITLRP